MNLKAAIQAIEKNGIILVFPIHNRKDPISLWSHFFPKKEMKWEWDDQGDNRVADLWRLKVELSETKKVVYTKWFRGRATYFSKTAFIHTLNLLNGAFQNPKSGLSKDADLILKILELDSPLSTKNLKKMSEMKGKTEEVRYTRAMKELWNRLLIVASGEVEDGAFPSLAVGSTQVLFEELWNEAQKISYETSLIWFQLHFKKSLFYQYFSKLSKSLSHEPKDELKTKSNRTPIPKVIRFEDL